MTIVLNEHEWAEEMIENRSLGKKSFETLSRVARYYLDSNYPKKEVRKMLDSFVLSCDPTASLPKWSDTIDYALERAISYHAINIDYISISSSELKKIRQLEGKQIQRLAFTLLCLAKYWDLVNPNGDHWVNNNDVDIMRMANVNTSVRRQSLLYNQLRNAGLIQFSKKVDNTNVRVLFIDNNDERVKISDFRNLGNQYSKYRGQPYFECQSCGIVTKIDSPRSGRKQRYCKECAAKIAMQQRINSVMRRRTFDSDNTGITEY